MDSTAKDIMTGEVLTVLEETTIEDALRILVNNRVTGLPVVNKEGKMVGVVSEYDLLVQLVKKEKPDAELFKQKIEFTKEVHSVKGGVALKEIVPMFVNAKFRRLPVVDDSGKLIGIITRRDMMRIYYYRAKLG
jgi:CBS domain-containing protein